jgi:hypothetical protein
VDDIELTELHDLDVVRQDAVENPASGFPFLIMKSVSKDINAAGAVNEKPDISGANKVLSQLAQLVASEARELAAGNENEIYDISLLLDTIRNMRCFRDNEMACDEMTAKAIAEVNDLIAKGEILPMAEDATKDAPESADNPTSAAPEPQAGDEFTKDTVAKMIEDAKAEVSKEAEERNAALAAELAVLKATPIPGNVKLTATADQRDTRAQADVVAKAAYHRRQLDIVQDRDLIAYHKAQLAKIEPAANA